MASVEPTPVLQRLSAATKAPQLSVLIPVLDEAGNIGLVLDEIYACLNGRLEFEIVCIDDGSKDGSSDLVTKWAETMPVVQLIRHERRTGKSAALRSGARVAAADWLVTIDGDGQYDPNDIHALIAAIETASGVLPALVYGIRTGRQDTWSRRTASRFANGLRKWMLRDGCPDTGCGLKLIHREVLLNLALFEGMHRFLPALVQAQGHRIEGVPVSHRSRLTGQSKYTNSGRALVGITDLMGSMWLVRRSPRIIARSVQLTGGGVVEPVERTRVGSR